MFLAHAGTEFLGEAAQAGFHVRQPIAQIVGTGVKLGVIHVLVQQPHLIGLQILYTTTVFRFRGRKPEAVVVEMQLGFSPGQVDVLPGGGLGAGNVFTQGPAHIAQLHQNTKLPVGDVVEPDSRWCNVITDVAPGLVQQALTQPNQGGGGGKAGGRLLTQGGGIQLHGAIYIPQGRL